MTIKLEMPQYYSRPDGNYHFDVYVIASNKRYILSSSDAEKNWYVTSDYRYGNNFSVHDVTFDEAMDWIVNQP